MGKSHSTEKRQEQWGMPMPTDGWDFLGFSDPHPPPHIHESKARFSTILPLNDCKFYKEEFTFCLLAFSRTSGNYLYYGENFTQTNWMPVRSNHHYTQVDTKANTFGFSRGKTQKHRSQNDWNLVLCYTVC